MSDKSVGVGTSVIPAPCCGMLTFSFESMFALYCTFAGTFAESLIIDSEHWRHFYLITGALRGLMLASRRLAAAPRVPPRPALAPQGRRALST